MAKISARGDSEVARWTGPGGKALVLTAQGRLLYRWTSGAGYALRERGADRRWAEEVARRLGLEAA